MSEKIISVTLTAPFGFLKKTDINEDIFLTHNLLHKPAVLGILGAISGLGGFSQSYFTDPKKLPEYYKELSDIPIGIKPITGYNSAVFKKSYLKYNNSTGSASEEPGGNLIVKEQFLVKPKFRVYLKLDESIQIHKTIIDRLNKSEAVFIPYLGKNEYHLWWEDFSSEEFENFIPQFSESYQIDTIFIKKGDEKITSGAALFALLSENSVFTFERLPTGYDTERRVYKFDDFVYTNSKICRLV